MSPTAALIVVTYLIAIGVVIALTVNVTRKPKVQQPQVCQHRDRDYSFNTDVTRCLECGEVIYEEFVD